MSLDLEAALRQTIATSYLQKDVDRLLAGRLKMAPHPAWELPEVPTWREDPFKDRNWRFQFHMLRWLEPLRRAAGKGDDAAFDMWLHWVQDWVAKNPPKSPRTSWAWTDMSDGIRAQQFCQSAPMIAERRPDLLPWLEENIRVHAEHLADPHKMGNANHALHQQESLFVCGHVLGEERLWKLASDRMSSLLHEQYDEQGVNAEGAVAYHYNNYLWWERALERFDKEGLERPDGAGRHLHAPEQIAHATRPDGTLVQIGDTDTVDPRAIASPYVEYVTTAGAQGTPPSDTARVYDAGYVFARSGWGSASRPYSQETFYSARFGPSRRVHGHPDGTSITFSAVGVNWIADLGKYQYGKSTPREHFVSRSSHSLVSVEGKRPRKDAHVTLLRQAITDSHHDLVFSDDSFKGIDLARRVIFSISGEYLVVEDRLRASRPVHAIQRWQTSAGVSVELGQAVARLRFEESNAALNFLDEDSELSESLAQEDPFDGWISTGWKKMAPAAAVLARRSGGDLTFLTVLSAGRKVEPDAQLLSRDVHSAALSVRTDAGFETLSFTDREVSIVRGQ